MIRRLARWLLFATIATAVIFGLAGRTDVPVLWGYLFVVSGVGLVLSVLVVDPERARERLKKQKTADPAVLFLVRALSLGHIALGALDVGRLHWSDGVPLAASAAALGALALACGVTIAAITANRFFAPALRIQTERGHRVVDTGPYRYVRHPGYAGMLVAAPASGLALGSWLACAVGGLGALAFAYRAAYEDRFLRENLQGYDEYASRVRYRLVPGLW